MKRVTEVRGMPVILPGGGEEARKRYLPSTTSRQKYPAPAQGWAVPAAEKPPGLRW